MNPRIISVVATTAVAVRTVLARAGRFVGRFARNRPNSDHERRIFAHLNGLMEACTNQLLGRTFAPIPLSLVQ